MRVADRREHGWGDRGLLGSLESGSGGGNWKASQDLRSTGWLVVPGDQTHPCSTQSPPKTALWKQAISVPCPQHWEDLSHPQIKKAQETKHSYKMEPENADIIITAQPSHQQATNRFKLNAY